jgi:hypothetical protein
MTQPIVRIDDTAKVRVGDSRVGCLGMIPYTLQTAGMGTAAPS